jgi:hypothetical protein
MYFPLFFKISVVILTVVQFQMLMSFVYFASILGQTLSQDTQYWLGVAQKPPRPHHPNHRYLFQHSTPYTRQHSRSHEMPDSSPVMRPNYGSGDATSSTLGDSQRHGMFNSFFFCLFVFF